MKKLSLDGKLTYDPLLPLLTTETMGSTQYPPLEFDFYDHLRFLLSFLFIKSYLCVFKYFQFTIKIYYNYASKRRNHMNFS